MARSKKKASASKGTPIHSNVNIPANFTSMNNPTFHLCLIIPGHPEVMMMLPYQDIPLNIFRGGVDSPTIHHTAKEALSMILTQGLKE